MAPVPFADIAKKSNEVINDDFHLSGYQFKAKQKTNWNGAVFSSQVDLFPKGEDKIQTPAKLTWKLPSPLGCPVVAVDKLELDKTGAAKLEISTEKAYPKLKIDSKVDLKDITKATAGFTYSGIAATQLKLETKVSNPQDFTFEATREQGPATLGLKYSSSQTSPDVAANFANGPFFASLVAKDAFKSFAANALYKVNDDVKVAAIYNAGGKQNGQFALAASFQVKNGPLLKAKVQQDQSISVGVKHSIAKGFTVLGGGKYDTAKGNFGYGVQLSIE